MKTLRQKKWFRTMCWKLLSALVAGAGAYLAELDATQFAFVITIGTMLLDQFMKFMNVKFFNDLGVEK